MGPKKLSLSESDIAEFVQRHVQIVQKIDRPQERSSVFHLRARISSTRTPHATRRSVQNEIRQQQNRPH